MQTDTYIPRRLDDQWKIGFWDIDVAAPFCFSIFVGYVSSNTQPSGYRRITVRVARPGVQARTRAGYYAGKSQLTR